MVRLQGYEARVSVGAEFDRTDTHDPVEFDAMPIGGSLPGWSNGPQVQRRRMSVAFASPVAGKWRSQEEFGVAPGGVSGRPA